MAKIKKADLRVITLSTKKMVWDYRDFESATKKAEWLRELIKLPGELKYDSRIAHAYAQATHFEDTGVYTEMVEDTFDCDEYWDRQKELCQLGMLIDDEFYVTGDHYWYLNFIKIPDKVKGGPEFPRFQDLDAWTFQCIDLAILSKKFMVVLKARQTGFTLKFLARMLKRVWFEKGFTGKFAAYASNYISRSWNEILVPYRNHLNEHTGWYREFKKSETKFHWSQQYEYTEGGKKSLGGNLSSLNGISSQQKASAVVSGKTDELLYDEAGVSLNVAEVMALVVPALKFGNILTGYAWVVGAAGEMKESESLKKLFYAPDINNFLSFPNVWSGRPEERVGFFVPYYYSYGDCVDEWGNSDIEQAKKEFAIEAEIQKQNSYRSYAIFKAQYPSNPEDAFSIQEENIFPVEKIQEHLERLSRDYKGTVVTLINDPSKPTGISHRFGSESGEITDFPVKANTDRRGALVVDEFPEENPPFGLYYVSVDPIRPVRTDTSESLQSVHVYKAAHRIDGEFTEDKLVAWYCGRHDDAYATYEITKKIIKRWNARAAIESDQASCIEWMIKEKMGKYLMKRSDIPILKDWVPTSQIHEEYGWRTGSGNSAVKNHLFALIIEYCNEVISTEFDTTGESREVFGVRRIKDAMLLRELLAFNPKRGNYDRIISFAAALMVARANTNRGIVVIRKEVNAAPPPVREHVRGLTTKNIMKSSFGRRSNPLQPIKR